MSSENDITTKGWIAILFVTICVFILSFMCSCNSQIRIAQRESQERANELSKWEMQVRNGEITPEDLNSLIKGENDLKKMKHLSVQILKKQ